MHCYDLFLLLSAPVSPINFRAPFPSKPAEPISNFDGRERKGDHAERSSQVPAHSESLARQRERKSFRAERADNYSGRWCRGFLETSLLTRRPVVIGETEVYPRRTAGRCSRLHRLSKAGKVNTKSRKSGKTAVQVAL